MMRRSLSLVALSVALLAGSPLSADIVRESTGQRRVELDRMELQAFPADAWGQLSSWTNADAAPSMKERPVLIVGWASWNQASLKAIVLAQKMADKFGAQGLVVIGIHHPQGWADAAEAAKSRGVKFPIALDTSGGFRKAIKIDHEPEFYILDRAGHLRYAAVASQSVEEALTEVTTESAKDAGDVPALVRKRATDASAAAQRTSAIRSDIDLTQLPAVPPGYSQPPESTYKAASWPKMDDQAAKDFGLVDQSGKRIEPKFSFSPAGYFPTKPTTQGRATVVYLWHPDMLDSFDKVMPQMDRLQQQNLRDLAVIGALEPITRIDPSRNSSDPNLQESPEKLQRKYQAILGSRNFSHSLAADVSGSAMGALGNQFGGGTKFPIPGAMIISSDGIIRWIGSVNSPDFKYAIDTVLASDPGIQARRIADRAYIENTAK